MPDGLPRQPEREVRRRPGHDSLRGDEAGAGALRPGGYEREILKAGSYQQQECEKHPVRKALLPVLLRLRGLRGDDVYQAPQPDGGRADVRGTAREPLWRSMH